MHTNVGRSKGILEEVTLVSSLCERPVGFRRTFSIFLHFRQISTEERFRGVL
jgi:hypothetical protein